MTVEEDAIWLAKAVWRLDKKGFINASGGDDEEEAECEHLRHIAIQYMEKIRKWELEKENSTERVDRA